MTVRPAAVSGRFYPADPVDLAALLDRLLAAVRPRPCPSGRRPVALVAPHAGYRYCGTVAAAAYAQLTGFDGGRVVVLGPAHFEPLTGCAVPSVDAFATPLGPVRLDAEARRLAVALPGVVVDDHPHAGEHALETQLPFLIRTLGPDVRVLPVLAGRTDPAAVAGLLSALLTGPDVVAVVSTDLSHYLDRARAQQRDARTVAAVLARDAAALRPGDACGYHPLRGLVRLAAERDLGVELLHLATSADAGADPARVVGYGAFLLAG
jgi:AmmeMemoRadiSam system protein B